MSEMDPKTRRADVVILTAIRLEFDAVLKVDAGAVPGLLLARNDGDWWKALLQQNPAINALLADREPVKLSPLATTTTDC